MVHALAVLPFSLSTTSAKAVLLFTVRAVLRVLLSVSTVLQDLSY